MNQVINKDDYDVGYSHAAHGIDWQDIHVKNLHSRMGFNDCNNVDDPIDVFGDYRFCPEGVPPAELLPWPYREVGEFYAS